MEEGLARLIKTLNSKNSTLSDLKSDIQYLNPDSVLYSDALNKISLFINKLKDEHKVELSEKEKKQEIEKQRNIIKQAKNHVYKTNVHVTLNCESTRQTNFDIEFPNFIEVDFDALHMISDSISKVVNKQLNTTSLSNTNKRYLLARKIGNFIEKLKFCKLLSDEEIINEYNSFMVSLIPSFEELNQTNREGYINMFYQYAKHIKQSQEIKDEQDKSGTGEFNTTSN